MEEKISTEVNLPDLYSYVLTKSLPTNFTLTEEAIDRIHRGILREMRTKCKILVKEGLVTNEEISRKLDYQVASILHEAKEANKKRKFSWNAEKIKGLYNGFPCPVYDCEVVEGGDNDAVVREIRRWLCDFNNFCSSVKGNWETVGCNYDKVKEDLQVKKLLPGICTSNKTSRNIDEVAYGFASDIIIHPIEMKLFAHDPNAVEMVPERLTLSYWKLKYSITNHGIHRSSSTEGNIEFDFPCYSKVNVNSTVKADIEFKATKEYKMSSWTLALCWIYDTCKSKTFVHPVKLIIRTPDTSVKLRNPVTIEINKEQADTFMEHYNHFKGIAYQKTGSPDNSDSFSLPGESFIVMHERFPWLLFVETLRYGDAKAAMEMVKEQPEVLRNLPGNENNVLGITFEELQIAKIMAEAIRINNGNIYIELIAGDGQGKFRYDGKDMETLEYVDAVFRNTQTEEYFSVLFKYTDEAEKLVKMMQNWKQHCKTKEANDKYPDAMKLASVKLIGPADVVSDVTKKSIDVGDEVRSNFEKSVRIGFKYPIDETKTMRKFLDDNETLLKRVVNSHNYIVYQRVKNDISKLEKNLKSSTEKLIEMTHQNLKPHPQEVTDMQNMIAKHEKNLKIDKYKIKLIEGKWWDLFRKELNPAYRHSFTTEYITKEAVYSIAAMAAVDGITAFVCSFGDELKKYHKGDHSFEELTKVVAIKTIIGVAKGGSFGLTLSGLTMGAKYATARGVAYAGTLTVVSEVSCPIAMAGIFMKQSYDIINQWNAGDITTAEMEKAFGRSITANGLSIGGMLLCGSAIGGTAGLVVGAGLAIAVGVGDYFLGDKIWSAAIIEEDPKEAAALMKRKINNLHEYVLRAAYDLLDLTEYSTTDEIKVNYRKAILKYHPDKGGNAEIFHAVHAAYAFICKASSLNFDT